VSTDHELRVEDVLKGNWIPGRVVTIADFNSGRLTLSDGASAETVIRGFKPMRPGARYLMFLVPVPHYRQFAAIIERAKPGGAWEQTAPGIGAYELLSDGTVDPLTTIRSPENLPSTYRGVPRDKLLADVRAALR
jgi:hypothetical protein